MNRLILDAKSMLDKDHYLVQNLKDIEHIATILKLKIGDPIKVCLVGVGLGVGIIKRQSSRQLTIKVIQQGLGHSAKCHLILAINRPPMMKRIIEHGTTLGVKSFHFITTALSDKNYLQSKILKSASFEHLTNLGLGQSNIYFKRPTFSLSSHSFEIPLLEDKTPKFIFDGKDSPAPTKISPFQGEFVVALGPERGWTTCEINSFLEKKFQKVSLGPATLRVEQALYFGLGQIGQYHVGSSSC